MLTCFQSLADLSDRDLLAAVQHFAATERTATTRLIASLAELDARRLYLAEGCSSLFTYCTQVLHLSEHAAYGRIEAARAARRYPVLLEGLESGDLTLTAVGLLAPHLTFDNHKRLIEARHRSKREIERLVAVLRPQPPVLSVVSKVPQAAPHAVTSEAHGSADAHTSAPAVPVATALAAFGTSTACGQARPKQGRSTSAVVVPLDAERYKVQCTVSRDTYEKLRRIQDLMRHTNPRGDLSIILERALAMLLEHLERTKLAQVSRPRCSHRATTGSRHIPAAIRRAVWRRDQGRCAFVGTRGRCTERGFLEFHHVVPFADGGTTAVENVQLRCRAHNQYESDQWFGMGEPPILRERPDDGHYSVRTESRP